MMTRRQFLQRSAQVSLVGATTPLWTHSVSTQAFAQMASSPYKAIVVVSLHGGNDGNNMLIPINNSDYTAYSKIRGALSLPIGNLLPLQGASGSPTYGLHPSMPSIAALYNTKKAVFVANVGPLVRPVTKAQIQAKTAPTPESLMSHPAGIAEWESSGSAASPHTGWGGRIADLIASQSGTLPPVLNGGLQSTFTVGQTIQAVAMQGGLAFAALPPGLTEAAIRIAQGDCNSANALVAQTAKLRVAAGQQQTLIDKASSYKTLSTQFPGSGFGQTMQRIAQIIGGHSVLGASRQIFYTQQGGYDSHVGQLPIQAANLQDLDSSIGAFFNALDELGMTNQVLVCTHSDFNRTYAVNANAGSDHGWGNHQILLGGGIAGGRILGQMPTLELGGPDDLVGLGVWVPTTSVTQLTSSMGSWFGLNASQVATVFPDLTNFPTGSLILS